MKIKEFRSLLDWDKIKKLLEIEAKLFAGLPKCEWGKIDIAYGITHISLSHTIYDYWLEDLLAKTGLNVHIDEVKLFASEKECKDYITRYISEKNLTTANDEEAEKALNKVDLFDEHHLLRPTSFGRDYYATSAILIKKFEEGYALCVVVYL